MLKTKYFCVLLILVFLASSNFAYQLNNGSLLNDEFFGNDTLLLDSSASEKKFSENNTKKIEWYTMITEFPGDMYQFAKAEVKQPDLPVYLTIATLTTGLLITDDKTWDVSHKWYEKNSTVYSLSNFFTEVGDGRTQFGLAAVFGLYGTIASDNKALNTASQIVEAVLSSGAIVQIFKHITGRESPYLSTRQRGTWRWFPNQIQYHKHVPAYDAYPSGHICTSVAAFVVIADNYPEQKWLTPIFTLTTAAIGVGMVNKGIHWYSDYPLGIAVGYTFGKMITKKYAADGNQNVTSNRISFFPYMGEMGTGISLTYKL